VIPGIIDWIAGNTGRNPLLIDVVPDVPLVASGDTAFMSPDKSQAIKKLVYIKLKSLCKL
jgi:hypothetical protein